MNIETLKKQLVIDEGLKLFPYRDTMGIITIGIGRNLEHRGITREEAYAMCENDINDCLSLLTKNIPGFSKFSDARQQALCNMCFNLGWEKLAKFNNMLMHIQRGEWEEAASAALNSLWAKQVGDRAKRIAKLLRDG